MAKISFPQKFEATGRGWYNKLPDTPATQDTGTGYLRNRGLAPSKANHLIWLYITEIVTGWTIAGDYGQANQSRTFYPRNLSQTNFTMRGITPNMYEYDRLVEFVTWHHRTALAPDDKLLPKSLQVAVNEDVIYAGQHGSAKKMKLKRGFLFEGYVLGIEAGHRRFEYGKEFELEIKVAANNLEKSYTWDNYTSKKLIQSVIYDPYTPALPNREYGPSETTVHDTYDFWNTNAPTDTQIDQHK